MLVCQPPDTAEETDPRSLPEPSSQAHPTAVGPVILPRRRPSSFAMTLLAELQASD